MTESIYIIRVHIYRPPQWLIVARSVGIEINMVFLRDSSERIRQPSRARTCKSPTKAACSLELQDEGGSYRPDSKTNVSLFLWNFINGCLITVLSSSLKLLRLVKSSRMASSNSQIEICTWSMKHSRQNEFLPVMVRWTYDLYHPPVDVADWF